MARRKSVLVFLLFCLMVLILSPWADAPSPSSPSVAVQERETLTASEPEAAEESSRLTIEVAMDEEDFHALSNRNDDFTFRHPDIEVELRRISPGRAYDTYRNALELEQAPDVMLVRNEWVKPFAASGYLLPADAAFAGKSMAEQFEALTGQVKWNGYHWGVPRDMDPYVVVWNEELLRGWLGEEAALPLTAGQWLLAAEASAATQYATGWLTIAREDFPALLAWLESATDERSDDWWERGNDLWSGTPQEQALTLLETGRAGIGFAQDAKAALAEVESGRALAAVVPYSDTAFLERDDNGKEDRRLEIDHHAWRLPFTWPRGTSYVISSRTEAEEQAAAWIAEMTGEQAQLQHLEEQGKLPVYRSFYDGDRRLSNLLPGRAGQSFPNVAPHLAGPDAAERLSRVGERLGELALGELTAAEWKAAWTEEADGKSGGEPVEPREPEEISDGSEAEDAGAETAASLGS